MAVRSVRSPESGVRSGATQGSLSIEYAVLLAVVVAALIGMSVYTMRALSGRWRTVGDTFGYGRQYQP